MSLLETAEVAGIVLDLQRQSRDALILLRQLQQRTRVPPMIAVGDESATSVIGVLLEAGCTALLTEKPVDIQLADWYERVAGVN
jgi:CheY-like chemotaxis protein